MADLREQLEQSLRGRVCWMGLGNVELGDDGFGVRLAESLRQAGVPDVVIAGTVAERYLGSAVDDFDHVVFLDAVDFDNEPGCVVFLDCAEIVAEFAQISTHKIALGTLARWVESNGRTRAWLLGVQPQSLSGTSLTPPVEGSRQLVHELIYRLQHASMKA